jgi:hypothetical protein
VPKRPARPRGAGARREPVRTTPPTRRRRYVARDVRPARAAAEVMLAHAPRRGSFGTRRRPGGLRPDRYGSISPLGSPARRRRLTTSAEQVPQPRTGRQSYAAPHSRHAPGAGGSDARTASFTRCFNSRRSAPDNRRGTRGAGCNSAAPKLASTMPRRSL